MHGYSWLVYIKETETMKKLLETYNNYIFLLHIISEMLAMVNTLEKLVYWDGLTQSTTIYVHIRINWSAEVCWISQSQLKCPGQL